MTSALRLIMRSSKIEHKTSSITSAVWRAALKPNVVNTLLFNFCEQKFVKHGPITLVIEEKSTNYTSGRKSAPKNDLFWVHRLFNVCVQVFSAPNATILLIYPPKSKWTLSGILSKSIADPLSKAKTYWMIIFVQRKDKTNYLSNQTCAKCYHSRKKH